jgi:hypothetical protein
MIQWHIKKIKAKWWKITFPWNNKMVKVRVNRRLDILVAIDFLKFVRFDGVGERSFERMYVEGKGYVGLFEEDRNYLDYLENGL